MSEQTKPLSKSLRDINKTRWIAITGLFMALNIAMSSFGIPVPGGHLYLCDIIICTAALLLDPVAAFFVGGLGSFLGDMIFYPAPMFVSLFTHGLQAFVIALFARKGAKLGGKKYFAYSLAGTVIGAVIMVVGYTLGKTFVYATFEYAMIKLPFEIAQGALGVVASLLLVFKLGLGKLLRRYGPY
ncbi:MAG: ECF transporter S component [Lachnospiraceae bacterium]|nr:ECF transporter S component [Lachnospiraceae bacterium]